MIPQHLLESSFVPTSPTPNDPGQLLREKAFYGERNKAAQAATQWEDQMSLEREKLEADSELGWAKFNWQKEWEPEQFYAGLDFSREQFDFKKSSWGAEMDEMRGQNKMAMDFMSKFGPGGGDDPNSGFGAVYGEGYFGEGGEGYTGSGRSSGDVYDPGAYQSAGLSGGDYQDFGLSGYGDSEKKWYDDQVDDDIEYGWGD